LRSKNLGSSKLKGKALKAVGKKLKAAECKPWKIKREGQVG